MKNPTSILITGASSGLGAALAKSYAAPTTSLFLQGRNAVRLAQTAEICRSLGADVHTICLDVTETEALAAWIQDCDTLKPIDLILANAGISVNTGAEAEGLAAAKKVFRTNVDGVLNTIYPALSLMKARHRGQIGLVSSLAGFRGMPTAAAYGASKAAVRLYGEALRPELAQEGIELSVICPGFVTTPMTDVNPYPMPFKISASKAAQIIQRGLAANKRRIAFPWPMTLLVKIFMMLPEKLITPLLLRVPRKRV